MEVRWSEVFRGDEPAAPKPLLRGGSELVHGYAGFNHHGIVGELRAEHCLSEAGHCPAVALVPEGCGSGHRHQMVCARGEAF